MRAFLIHAIVGQPTLTSLQLVVKKIAIFAIHLVTTKWGGKHGFLPLVLSEAKMQLDARDNNLDWERHAKPKFLNPIIEDDTKGRNLIQLQEYQKVKCQ